LNVTGCAAMQVDVLAAWRLVKSIASTVGKKVFLIWRDVDWLILENTLYVMLRYFSTTFCAKRTCSFEN
jgi:hypothetical protein